MDSFENHIQKLRSAFLDDKILYEFIPRIVAIFLGGSRLYLEEEEEEEGEGENAAPRGWDGVIVVDEKYQLHNLTYRRERLRALVGIEREECAESALQVPRPGLRDPRWDEFDAVRIAGYDKQGARRSVTMVRDRKSVV